ncbi:peptide MFS transporter [Clostridium frigidicarnis]|uniref:Amino acid/peptide transporter (Peptide:H+ symporter) n=1 Tax=Clostridium frigidicarnis TaxID=84698 RepID=A0A1I0WAF9_9CLOT|nr:peptide MFS transporter [Clostridium frigidicarnis]SFA85003.1 amino acid/peptide transporter (Peptide:H+ symporter) [Clostridium frigidicarnis]
MSTPNTTTQVGTQQKKHPKGLYVCGFTVAFERFAFYGSRTLLLLFLAETVAKGGLGIGRSDAAIIAADLAAWTYLAPIFGGVIADRWIGPRWCVIIGSFIMASGYAVGYFATSVIWVHAMIILISIGTGFFKGNINSLLGELYDKTDSRKDMAFSILYSFVNLGAFLGPLLTGIFVTGIFATKSGGQLIQYGYREVFLMAAVLTLISGIFFILTMKYLGDVGKVPNCKLQGHENIGEESKSNEPLTHQEKQRVKVIMILIFFTVIFWFAYNQAGSSIALYMKDFVNLNVGGFEVPVNWVDAINGLMCIGLSPVMAIIWEKLANSKRGDLSMAQKIGLGCILLGLGFLFMVGAEMSRGGSDDQGVKASILWILFFMVFQTLGEMCFSPIGSSVVSKLAPAKYLSLLMGSWTIGTFVANKLAGYVQGIMETMGRMQVFIAIPVILVVSALLMIACNKKLEEMTKME